MDRVAGPRRLVWSGLLPRGLLTVVALSDDWKLIGLSVGDDTIGMDEVDLDVPEGMMETAAWERLRRGIARTVSGATSAMSVQERLQRFTALWRRSSSAPLLEARELPAGQPGQAAAFGVRLFSEHSTSNTVTVSWQLLGNPVHDVFFEISLRSGAQNLGSFVAPGGRDARSFTARHLQPLRWHRVRCRAVQHSDQRVASEWSNEVSLKTGSLEEAKAAGRPMTADRFFVESEQGICALVRGEGQPGDAGDATLGLNGAVGALGDVAVKDLLDARSCQGGWREFARCGMRYSRPRAGRDERLRRTRISIAAQELYGTEYSSGNHWFMGPFYSETAGKTVLEQALARGEDR